MSDITPGIKIFLYILSLSESEQLDVLMQEFALEIAVVSLQKQAPSPAQLLPVNVLMQEFFSSHIVSVLGSSEHNR